MVPFEAAQAKRAIAAGRRARFGGARYICARPDLVARRKRSPRARDEAAPYRRRLSGVASAIALE